MIKLKGQAIREKDFEKIKEQISTIFLNELFIPLAIIIKEYAPTGVKKILNSQNGEALRQSLYTGEVTFSRGVFSGNFSAAISKDLRAIGAVFKKREGIYYLPSTPSWVLESAAIHKSVAKAAHDKILATLDIIEKEIAQSVYHFDSEKEIEVIQEGINESLEKIEVKPTLSPASWEKIETHYNDNLNYYVKEWASEQISELRQETKENALAGYRFDVLADRIEERFGVSQRKAEFLARNETKLFMTELRKAQFSEVGIEHYEWRTSHDERVRSDHKVLDGKIFRYDHPPIADIKRGLRANPSQLWNCRCQDYPIFKSEIKEGKK